MLIKQSPGIAIPELAQKMGIKQNYLYRVLPDLQQQGLIRKEGRAWHPAEPAATSAA
jgi:DNA-binding IclR family transcriptional regulator